MATSVVEQFIPLLTRLLSFFEPLAPTFVSLFLKRRLKEWKDKGLIEDYTTRTTRIGKFHYKIDVDFVLTPKQARIAVKELVVKIPKMVREVSL